VLSVFFQGGRRQLLAPISIALVLFIIIITFVNYGYIFGMASNRLKWLSRGQQQQQHQPRQQQQQQQQQYQKHNRTYIKSKV
jgi:uncharacterized membrane protein YkgB